MQSAGVADFAAFISSGSEGVIETSGRTAPHEASHGATNKHSEHRSSTTSSGRVADHWLRVERLLRERVARSLTLLDVPSKDEVDSLARRIDKLGKDVKDTHQALAQELTERTNELEHCAADLIETRSSLDQAYAMATLASVVPALAHDISTPVGNSNLAVSTLHARLKTFRAKAGKGELRQSDLDYFLNQMEEGLIIIETAGARVGELTESLKHLSIDHASGRRRSFELDELVKEVLTTLAPSLRKTTLQIETDISFALKMNSYPGALGQILINLLQNAMLHAFAGREQGIIRIEAEAIADGKARIVFSDDGIGMSAEALDKVFTPFFTTRVESGGSGVGLAYSRRLVENQLGGSISVSATPESGTRFVIELPCYAPESKDQRVSQAIATKSTSAIAP